MTGDIPESIRIGNCSGFFGDRLSAAAEVVADTQLDFLTGDWLAELTMSILRRQRDRDPELGWASTFVRQLEAVLGTCVDRGTRIVANAGGLNPAACARAVEALGERLGVEVRVGYVEGDDLMPRVAGLLDADLLRPYGPAAEDVSADTLLAANAYVGAWGIADCLDRGADVVVTGRVTDASLAVGPAAHAFRWARDDWDALAGAVVAGHVIECGGQATGGNFSFFEEVPGLDRIGFPVAELSADGSSVISRAGASGGMVTTETVTAQLLYEIQTEQYLNPDVTTLLTSVRLEQDAPDAVTVSGVHGGPPPADLKVSCVIEGGFRNAVMLGLTGVRAAEKAAAAEAAVWAQVPGGREAFDEVDVALLGVAAEDPVTHAAATTFLRIAVRGQDERVVGRAFSDAVVATGLCSYPGFFMTSPPSRASAFDRYSPALVPAAEVTSRATVDGSTTEVLATAALMPDTTTSTPSSVAELGEAGAQPPSGQRPSTRARLGDLAGARSGDKGGDANLGIWVRDPAAYPWLVAELTVERLRELLPEADGLAVTRHLLPNLSAVNFVIEGFLGEGVSSCLRVDGQAKGLAEYVRSRYVDVPTALLA